MRFTMDLDKEQNKLSTWAENGKDIYSFPMKKTQQLYKQWAFCSAGFQLGIYELSEWKGLKGILEN